MELTQTVIIEISLSYMLAYRIWAPESPPSYSWVSLGLPHWPLAEGPAPKLGAHPTSVVGVSCSLPQGQDLWSLSRKGTPGP